MRKEVVEELVTLDAGDYWLGDPCYVIRDEDWMPWLEATDYQTETNLIGEIPGSLLALAQCRNRTSATIFKLYFQHLHRRTLLPSKSWHQSW